MKKSKEYIPQFADINLDEDKSDQYYRESRKVLRCSKCKLITEDLHNGMCEECFRHTEIKINVTEPDEDLYNSWCEAKIEAGEGFYLLQGVIGKSLRKYGIAGLFVVGGLAQIVMAIVNMVIAVGIPAAEIFADILTKLLGAATCFIVAFAVIKIRRYLRHQRFMELNELTVYCQDYSEWSCPSCGSLNRSKKPCKFCGVFPKIVIKGQQNPLNR